MNPQLREGEYFLQDTPRRTKIANASVMDLDDGSAVIEYDGPAPINPDSPHYENLAANNRIPQHILDQIGGELVQAIEDDEASREEWMNIVKEALNQLGTNMEDVQNLPFDKACGLFSPIFMQLFQQTKSKIERELFPPNGLSKMKNEGEETEEVMERSDRIEDFMNFYVRFVEQGIYPELRQMNGWTTLVGNGFTKTFFNEITKRVVIQQINPHDFLVNNAESSLSNCSRITQVIHLSEKELRQRQYAGLYNSTKITPDYDNSFDNQVSDAINDMQGTEAGDADYNRMYTFYESHVDLDLEGFEHVGEDGEITGIPLPYIVTIDKDSQKVIAIYRNWKESDPDQRRIEYFTHFKYSTGFGFWGYGLVHIAGGAAKASTALLRQVVDAGSRANFPAGFCAKGIELEENSVRLGISEFKKIDIGGMNSIRDAIYDLPFHGPDPTLITLKEGIEKGMMDSVSASQSQFGDVNPNAPVGTTIAYLNERNTVHSNIMASLYESMAHMLQIMYRLFAEHFHDIKYPYPLQGNKKRLMGSDFKEDLRVLPVADPNITSASLRLIHYEKMFELLEKFPEYFNAKVLITEFLRNGLKVQNFEEFITPDEEEPAPIDPVSENADALIGEGLKAYIFQDHDAHIQTHLPIRIDPNTPPEVAQAMQAHIQEHTAMKYVTMMQQMMGTELPEDPSQLKPEEQNKIAVAAAEASQKLMEMIQQQIQSQQPNVDAAAVQAQAMLIEAQAKDKEVDFNSQFKLQQLENERLKTDMETQFKFQQLENEKLRLEIERLKIVQTGKNEELKAETSGFEAQLRYETDHKKIELQSAQALQKQATENPVSNI